MTKYKHKQSGEVVSQSEKHIDNFYYDGIGHSIHKKFVENTDDWELVVEEVSGWFVNNYCPKWLMFKDKNIAFGISTQNTWFCDNLNTTLLENDTPATARTTLKMLSEYATELGYKKGTVVNTLIGSHSGIVLSHTVFGLKGTELWLGNALIMKDGIWATITKKPSSFTEEQLSELNELISKK